MGNPFSMENISLKSKFNLGVLVYFEKKYLKTEIDDEQYLEIFQTFKIKLTFCNIDSVLLPCICSSFSILASRRECIFSSSRSISMSTWISVMGKPPVTGIQPAALDSTDLQLKKQYKCTSSKKDPHVAA